jgi:polyhydroxybutyrate depolymerase
MQPFSDVAFPHLRPLPEEKEVDSMRLLQIAATLSMVLAATAAHAQPAGSSAAACSLPRASGMTTEDLTSGQRQRTYRLFVPPAYDGRQRLPLVLDLHGSGGNPAGQARTSGLETLAAREGFLVATLAAEGGRWNVPVAEGRADDVAYVSDVISHVAARVCTDESRVYATGFSGGGRMSSLLGCRLSSRIAAIAPVAGLRAPGECEGRTLPVLSFHGLADPQNPYDGKANRGAEWVESVPDALAGWARRNGCRSEAVLEDPPGPLSTLRYNACGGGEVRLIRIDGLGHRWARDEIDTTAAMWEFFKLHRLER